MINQHLVPHASYLDESNYQVVLHDRIDAAANESFLDDSYWSARWFREYWHRLFMAKMNAAEICVGAGDRVLDCCCGQGYLGELVEEQFGAEVTFCDLSASQLNALRARREEAGAAPAPIIEANLLSLPFADESFDWVMGNSFLHHVPDVPAALAELYRVTQCGGNVILFHEPTTTSIFWESFPLSLFKDTSPTDATGNFSDLWLFTAESLQSLFSAARFSSVQIFGTGMLAALMLNWYLILAAKLNWQSRFGVYPAYWLRVWLNHLDLAIQWAWKLRNSPSLMVVATRSY